MKTAVFTIASRNYFAFVRTLMDSLEQSNEGWDRYVVVVDEISKEFCDLPRNYHLISLDDLKLPEREKMKFRYSIMEFNTAVKPFAISLLFEEKKYDRVIYIDPDICVYEKMKEVESALDNGYDFVLTPHFTGLWEEDSKQPDEPAIMRAGIYNLGFLAINNCPETREMIHWWEKKLEYQCIVDIPSGVFVDQKWIDLVPGRYSKVYILRHEGYNIAYWNLSHRMASKVGGKYYFNNQPLIFFHYSGFNPQKTINISKHQDRFTINDVGVAKELFEAYAKKVLNNDFNMWKKFKYTYSNFSDGKSINDLFRIAYRENPDLQEKCGENPFIHSKIFYEENRKEVIDFILKYVWKTRIDLQNAFPNGLTTEYLNWFRQCAESDYNLSREYMKGTKVRLKRDVKPHVSRRLKIKNALFGILPKPVWNAGKKVYRLIKPKTESANQIDTVEMISDLIEVVHVKDRHELNDGVNLIGYIRSEHGVGEACRMTARCLENTDSDWNAYDYELGNGARKNDLTWDNKISDEINYDISIFNVNADQMYAAKENTPEEAWEGYKIGIWFWELMEFPDEWCESFKIIDEIWAPTRFIEETLKKKATCPVIYMPLGIERQEPKPEYDRNYYNLPEHSFLFLNMFDSLSYQSRKNPRAAIEAFKEAFVAEDESVSLVIKMNNQSMESLEMKELNNLKGNHKNIIFISKTYSRDEINGLINVCDAALSLHKSEGLGLLCEEAMYFGKPVIATNWSGNTDFMNEENSCLVNCELVPIGQNFGPYKFWQRWAEADICDAARYMLKLKNDRKYYDLISDKAQITIRNEFSPEVCGKRMQVRLHTIRGVRLKES